MIQVYTIRELEKRTGVARTTIYYYVREGMLPRPQKTAASRALYTDDHAKILKRITELKEAGCSLAEIEAQLQHSVDAANEVTVDLVAQEHERIHNAILALATQEFAARGYKSTHVTTIIRELGITPAIFYSHFSGKRRLLSEIVMILMQWSLEFVDKQQAMTEDPAERLLWLVFGHAHVFELGSAALALIRVEGTQSDSELRKPIEDGFAAIVRRIMDDLAAGRPDTNEVPPAVPDELVAHSLFGAYEQTVFRSMSDKKYGRRDLLRTHLWLFLTIQAARNGAAIDVGSRMKDYDELISRLASEMPPLPPILQS